MGQNPPAGVLPGLDPERELGQFALDLWTEREGLPQNFVSALAQTPDGYLWAGSERGLIRFDGRRFTTFTPQSNPGLPAAWVTALLAEDDGTLWIGTGNGGVARYRDGAFQSVEPSGDGIGVPVSALARGPGGDLWLSTEGQGVFRLDEAEGALRRIGAADGLSSDQVADLVPGTDEFLWIATPVGVDRIDPASHEVSPFPLPLPSGVGVQALHPAADGSVWVGTWGDGLLRLDGGEVARIPGRQGELDGAFITALLEDRQGALWVGTNGGGLYRKWDGTIDRLPDRTGVPTHLVRALLEDREGNLWIGLVAAGLARLQDTMFEHVGASEGLSMNVALAVREAEDGSIWVGTPGGGVNRVSNGEVTTLRVPDGLGSDFVVSVAESPEGEVWVGTAGGGASRIRNGEVETLGAADGLPAPHVSMVHHDAEGHVWMGFNGAGLLRWDPDVPVTLGVDDGLPHGFVTTALDDGHARLWVGTRGGLALVEGAAVTKTLRPADDLPHGFVTGMHLGEGGVLWVATMGGLARIQDGEVVALGEGAGLPAAEPMGVLEDGSGSLWISTSQGIVRAERSELDEVAAGTRERIETVRVYDRGDGLRSAEANGAVHPSGWRASDGTLWFPTMAGLLRIDPSRSDRETLPVVPRIETFLAEGRTIAVEDSARLEPRERTLEFRFSAPTFVAPERIRFRYRLEGLDEEWIPAGDAPVARYTGVPPGDYRFRVEASGRDGQWSGREVAMGVEVPHLLHERWDVRVAGLALLFLVGGLGYRTRIQRLQERERVLMEAIAERERATAALREREEELRQAHKMEAVGQLAGGIAHDLNNLLTVVSMSTHLAADARPEDDPSREDLDAAIQATERATELIRQLLAFSRRQVLQPSELNLNECVREVEAMLRRLIRADIDLELRLASDLRTIRADRNGIEQILVNLVINAQDAMPDGGAVTIATRNVPAAEGRPAVDLMARPHVLLTVSDTGEGMDEETRSRVFEPFFTTKQLGAGTGMGLASVYGIARQSGGFAEVDSRPGEGATFSIRFPRAEDAPSNLPGTEPANPAAS